MDRFVSVVMPVANAAAYLPQSIESILAQTLRDFEFVIVDDGSTDRSADIVRAFAARDGRIRPLWLRHGGVAAALNAGIAAASGTYIARMDADDVSRPTRLERQLAFMECHPDVAALGTAITLIDARGARIGRRRYPPSAAEIGRALRAGEDPLAHPTVMIRRAAVLDVGGYDARYRNSEDFELWLRLGSRFDLANLGEELLLYRMHGGQVGAKHRLSQIIATWCAIAADRRRQAGESDPFVSLDLAPDALPLAMFSPGELASLRLALARYAIDLARDAGSEHARQVAALAGRLATGITDGLPIAVAEALIAAASCNGEGNERLARGMAALAGAFAAQGRLGASRYWFSRACDAHPGGFRGMLADTAARAVRRALRGRR